MRARADTSRYPCDMHCHTTRSDGHDMPAELLRKAAKLGMAALAITDHDITPPLEIEGKDPVGFAEKLGLELILGYEFSCDTMVDDVHICGYLMQWDHPDVQAEVDAAAKSKSNAYRRLCGLLTEQGMPIDWETDILTHTDGSGRTAGRLPEEVQRKHIFEAMAVRGYTETWSDAKLLVRGNPELNCPRQKIGPLETINLIHRCGGIAVLAHPYLIDEKIAAPDRPGTRHEYILRLIDSGLDGIEARYTYNKTSYKGNMIPEAIEEEVRKLYGDKVDFLSGGSDYHGDAGKFRDPRTPDDRIRRLGERGLTIDEFNGIFHSKKE
jgi:3',5'-nucleoside bisphosphate phosphatase